MHIENLKVFSDLVESESFSQAAKLNGITQSAVSQQMRAMEKHFGVLVVDRSQKQFRLTREGNHIYKTAKEILYNYERLKSELQEMRKVVSGNIKIATIYSVGLHELPPYIKQFLVKFPEVNVRVEYRRSNLVYEDVIHNAVDFGLVAFPQKNRQLEVIPFKEDRLVVIVHPEHALAKTKTVGLQDIADQKFISFDPDIPTRKAIDGLFRDFKVNIDPVMEFDNVETVKRAVEIDAGIAIVPEATVRQEVNQGLLNSLTIKGSKVTRPIALIHRKGRVMTPATRQFVSLICGKNKDTAGS